MKCPREGADSTFCGLKVIGANQMEGMDAVETTLREEES